MEIRHLQTFKSIVEAGGFAKAALQLGYAQSTITAHIQALEFDLEGPLFDRLGKSIALTELGKSFLPYANEMLRLHKGAKELHQSSITKKGKITIGASESLTVYRLPMIIQSYKERYPDVHLSVRVGTCDELQHLVEIGDLDIALLLNLDFKKHPALEMEKMIDEHMSIIFSPNQLQPNSVLYSERTCPYRSLMDKFIAEQQMSPTSFHEFWSIEAIKQCVQCGLGMALVPEITIQNELREGKLAAKRLNEKHGKVATFLFYHKSRWVSPIVHYFIEEAKRYFEVEKQKTITDKIG
ncbi:LysR family transcriptional regulator [Bacillus sp. 03113]|uniref:LysR family transcriptional regulator n=1 Tax=Bacillus sp. 03113 TaxID=2578211 RepID=UPI0015E88652|nr:LysR family transcriptional regulator [Bacillus sp. 03113]